jgi:hypothetical protein
MGNKVKQITIETDRDIETLSSLCKTMLTKGKMSVTIQRHENSRTDAQRRLIWLWNSQIGDSLGWTKDEVHSYMKEHLSIPIFTRDNPGFSLMIDSVKQVKASGQLREYLNIKAEVIKLISTNDYNVRQGAEHLTDMERFATDKGIRLTHPEDIYYKAMGLSRKEPK